MSDDIVQRLAKGDWKKHVRAEIERAGIILKYQDMWHHAYYPEYPDKPFVSSRDEAFFLQEVDRQTDAYRLEGRHRIEIAQLKQQLWAVQKQLDDLLKLPEKTMRSYEEPSQYLYDHLTDEEKRLILNRAWQCLNDVCKGKKRFTMSIPVQSDDADMVFSAALNLLEKLLDQAEAGKTEQQP
jgi:hypothetical protein